MSKVSEDSGENCLAGGGELGALMRGFDWTKTPLGPVRAWPRSLKTAVRIVLTSRQPMWLGWGEQLIYFYNDPYRSIIGGKHPNALGLPTSIVWKEIWDVIRPMLRTAMTGVEGTYVESQLLIMERHGYREETYYTFSYSPIPDDTGRTGGILCANTDDTRRIIGERQIKLLRDLASRSTDARSCDEACRLAADSLATNLHDLPFAMIYVLEEDRSRAVLKGRSGIEAGHPAVPESIELSADSIWPIPSALESSAAVVVDEPARRFGSLPTGPWEEPPKRAVVLPIQFGGEGGRRGALIAGLNPFRLLDDGYRGFLDLVAGQISAAGSKALAYEEMTRRAEALAAIDRAKTAFFSNISHEFRTPLTLMLGPLQDTLANSRGLLPPEVAGELAMVHRNGLRLLKLVNALLDFARIEAGRTQAAYEPVDLATFTADLAGVFRSAIEKAGLQFIVDCPPLPEPVHVDRTMWEKIVLNLLSNAFKFTLHGEIEVKLRAAGDHVELSIRDTGAGIPEQELPRLFERFHRVEGTRGRTHEGTGIGLALVQELVKMHEGSIRVESRVDEGTTFTISIPLGVAHLPADRIRPAGASGTTTAGAFVEEATRWIPSDAAANPERPAEWSASVDDSSPPGTESIRRSRIVLADDNADMRDYVARLLSPQYVVEAVGDGQAALGAIRRERPDLVLADVMMPMLDGFGLLRAMRDDPGLASVPIVLLSARAGEEAALEGLRAGAEDYLVKPFSARDLLARIAVQLERRRFESALAAAAERLRSALTASRTVAWDWEPREDRIRFSETVVDVFGLSPDQTPRTGQDRLNLIHPDDLEPYRAKLLAAVEGETDFQSTYRIRRPADGATAWMEERGTALRDAASGEIRVTGITLDVTERIRVQEALRESEEFNRSLMDGSADCVTVLDPAGHLLAMNAPGMRQMEIEDFAPLCGRGWSALWPPEAARNIETAVAEARAGGTISFQAFCPTIAGKPRWWDVTVSPVRDRANGAIVRLLAVSRDVTDRRRQEEERERLLESERAARGDAERAGRMKDEFLATLSHELRTPLNAIMGWSQILNRGGLNDSDLKEGIEAIERNARAQTQMIEDLLDMSRIISGKVRLDVQRVNVADVIEQAVQSVLPSADARGVRLIKVLDPLAGPVAGDPSRLQQVIWNLLTNAIKFTPRGGRIQLVLERVNSHLEITVADTGEGIDPEFLPFVFDRFRQADGTTTRRHGGLGLGLNIVKQLVELHGGTVRAKSPGKGRGATFILFLPLAVTLHDEDDREGTRQHPRAETVAPRDPVDSPSLAGMKVLVVDDDADARQLTARMLREHDAGVLIAGSAREALALLRRERPNLVLSDIGMPEEDGYDLIRKIRSLPPDEGGRTPAVALTAFARAEDRRRALLAGYQMHVSKPVDPAELLTVVASVSGRLQPGVRRAENDPS